jgi:DNA-binding SARP family transcriptional activator
VRVDGRDPPPDVLWKKPFALLVYLALSPGRRRAREHLVGLLWPETEGRRARHSLNEALRRLRTGLGENRLNTVGDSVELNDAGLRVDVVELGSLGERATADPRWLASGEFLEGFAVGDAPRFDEWMDAERRRLQDRAVTLHLAAGERALAASRFEDAAEHARRALALHEFAERAVRLAMRAAALGGDPASALATYREFERRLAAELGEQASRELSALADRIRGRRWRRQSGVHAETEAPLVGRTDLHAQAFGRLADLRKGACTLVFSGSAGMGRSRLLSECLDRLGLDGTVVVAARPLDEDRHTPWSALRQLMRRGLATAQGVAAAPPEALRALAAVVPELAARVPPGDALDTAHVADALGAMLRAIAEEAPLALALDDAAHADAQTLTALNGAVSGVRALPIALLLAAPDDPREIPPGLGELLAGVGRHLPGAVFRLEPLAPDAIRELVGAYAEWCRDDSQRDRLTRRLAFESAGSPLLAVTLLRGLREVAALREDATVWPPPRVTMEAPVPMAIPHLIRVVTAARLRQLPDREREVLVAASAGGDLIEPRALRKVIDLADVALHAALAELERRQLLRFDGENYAPEAPLVARVVLQEFATPGQRQRLRDRWAAAREAEAR